MHPELLTLRIGSETFVVMSYSFFYILAVFFVMLGSYMALYKNNFSHKKIICMLGIMAVSGFVGARLLHVLFNPTTYAEGQLHIFDLHMRGFTIVGGLVFAVVGGFIGGKIWHVNIWRFGDISIPFVAFGIAIARVGCFLNGCCFGHVTHVPWGVKFPMFSFAHQYQITHELSNIFVVLRVHPTQVYELLYVIFGGIIALFINRKKIFDGAGILFFGMWFSAFRLVNMFFRQMPDSLILSHNKYALVYLAIFILCLAIFIYKYRQIKHSVV